MYNIFHKPNRWNISEPKYCFSYQTNHSLEWRFEKIIKQLNALQEDPICNSWKKNYKHSHVLRAIFVCRKKLISSIVCNMIAIINTVFKRHANILLYDVWVFRRKLKWFSTTPIWFLNILSNSIGYGIII